MIKRIAKLSVSHSFFILGPRGSGKSTLIRERFLSNESLYIDLLDPAIEDRYRLNLNLLKQELEGNTQIKRVIIDEVQKLPRILDLVHQLIEAKKIQFILSGSSARKLKKGGANLLAGRAFMFYLYPLTHLELGKKFNLKEALEWGLLPQLLHLKTQTEKEEYLKAYTLTYLKEEIQVEQLIRKLKPFRQFLDIVAQMNGKLVNYSKIARDIGVDTLTVQNYYSILEDTLIGFYLKPYHRSIRKSQRQAPKFYLFDTGICRALKGTLSIPLKEQSYDFGNAFEHFIILEIIKFLEYSRKSWKISYLITKEGAEIDLILERPDKTTACIEIKSSEFVRKEDLRSLIKLGSDIPQSNLYCFSREITRKKIDNVLCLHWQEGLKKIFNGDFN
ncbi:MAG: ATP-binding protein [Bdellovibrionales bacterium]|nr:ATP-binding protein [Bdellovibrionales bacterium]